MMNRLFLIIAILTICSVAVFFTVFTQDKIADELKILSDNKQYDKIIDEYAQKSEDYSAYSAKSLYYIGFAYYKKKDYDYNNCIKFMDLSIAKNAKDPESHYIKSKALNFMEKYDEAIKGFLTAINLDSGDAYYYIGLGDSYFDLEKYDLALETYAKATKLENCPSTPYSKMALIYAYMGKNDKALEAFYISKSKDSIENESYATTLFNIGLLESSEGNYSKAEPAFVERIKLKPKDYNSYAKLIQVYYALKEYDKAKPYKDKLYEAHRNEELEDNLKDMFCFDQFKWRDKLIKAYEIYEEETEKYINYKHFFYVINEEGKVEFRFQTEYSPLFSFKNGEKYTLGMSGKGVIHASFGIRFNEDFNYDDLKKSIIDILEGKNIVDGKNVLKMYLEEKLNQRQHQR